MIYAHYWKRIGNFGDVLVPIILKWISGQEVQWAPKEKSGKVLCVGSEMAGGVLQTGDIVWGYGTRHKKKIVPPPGVHFLAVRGKYTRSMIEGEVPEVYGDPGILMPLIYTPKPTKKRYSIGIVPHHAERHLFKGIEARDVKILDVAVKDVYKFIDEMNSCDLIVTSSLHSCIVAEAYGIPVVWILGQKDESEGFRLKFNDYFSGTGRGHIDPVILKNYSLKDIIVHKDKILPKPTFFREELIKSWKEMGSILGKEEKNL